MLRFLVGSSERLITHSAILFRFLTAGPALAEVQHLSGTCGTFPSYAWAQPPLSDPETVQVPYRRAKALVTLVIDDQESRDRVNANLVDTGTVTGTGSIIVPCFTMLHSLYSLASYRRAPSSTKLIIG